MNQSAQVQVHVNKLKTETGDYAVQLIVISGLLQMSFTLGTEPAKGLSDALRKQAEACDSSIILAPGPLPRTAGN